MSYRDAREALEARRESLRAELADLTARAAALSDLPQHIADAKRALAHTEADLRALPARRHSPLEQVQIASPCSADWNAMAGDERVRFCGQCRKNVYNLSAMSRDEAEALLVTRDGAMCVRLYRRADGTVLTADCPTGVRRKNTRRVALAIVGGGAVAAASALALTRHQGSPARPVAAVAAPSEPIALQGDIVSPEPVEVSPPQQGQGRVTLQGRVRASVHMGGPAPGSTNASAMSATPADLNAPHGRRHR